ncbi:MAG: hypothetical protein AAGH40_14180 [Verrucomicrobiota bacterium]
MKQNSFSIGDLFRITFFNISTFNVFSGLLQDRWSLRFISLTHIIYAAVLVYIYCQHFIPLEVIVFVIGVFLMMILIDRLVDFIEAVRMLRSIVRLSDTGVISSPRRVRFANYLGGNIGGRLDWGALGSATETKSNHFLFFMKPLSNSTFVSTFCMNINPYLSVIFVPYDRDDLNPQKFLIMLHEYGHAFMNSWERTRNYHSRLFSLTILSIPLVFLPMQVLLAFAIFLFIYAGSLWHFRRTLAFIEEAHADSRVDEFLVEIDQRTGESMSKDDVRAVEFAKKIRRRRNSVPADKKLYGFHRDLRQTLFKMKINRSVSDEDVVRAIRKAIFREGLISWGFIVPMLVVLAFVTSFSDFIAFELNYRSVVLEPHYPFLIVASVLPLLAIALVLMLSEMASFGKQIARRDDAFHALMIASQSSRGQDERLNLDLAHEYVDFEHIREHLLDFGNLSEIQMRVNADMSDEFLKRLLLVGAEGIVKETPIARWEEVLDPSAQRNTM